MSYPEKYVRSNQVEVGWIKRTPKSDEIERWRCHSKKDPARKVHKGVKAGSDEAGDGGRFVLGAAARRLNFS